MKFFLPKLTKGVRDMIEKKERGRRRKIKRKEGKEKRCSYPACARTGCSHGGPYRVVVSRGVLTFSKLSCKKFPANSGDTHLKTGYGTLP